MGHDSIDKHIKGKLEQRAIQPSIEAWEKLSNMLDEENEQSNKKGYYKYFVAASVVLLLGFFFTSQFKTTELLVVDDTVVNSEKDDVSSVNEVVITQVDIHFKNDVIIDSSRYEKVNTVVSKSVNHAYAQLSDQKEDVHQEEEINAIKEKVNQYLAQLEYSRKEKLNNEAMKYDLDAEINALLAEATNNLPDEMRNEDSPIFQLDEETDMLLANAFQELNINPEEDTVNETLKNKLFKELERGYFKSKMLLAERSQLIRP